MFMIHKFMNKDCVCCLCKFGIDRVLKFVYKSETEKFRGLPCNIGSNLLFNTSNLFKFAWAVLA